MDEKDLELRPGFRAEHRRIIETTLHYVPSYEITEHLGLLFWSRENIFRTLQPVRRLGRFQGKGYEQETMLVVEPRLGRSFRLGSTIRPELGRIDEHGTFMIEQEARTWSVDEVLSQCDAIVAISFSNIELMGSAVKLKRLS